MKPTAVYHFEQCSHAHTRYKLIDHQGEGVADFPAVWKRGAEAGNKYIGFRETVNHKPGHRHFTHTVEMDKGRTVTGLNFAPEYPHKTYGDYKADGLLIEFSETRNRLTVMFFKGMAGEAQSLFHKWVTGELPETAAANALPLELKKAG